MTKRIAVIGEGHAEHFFVKQILQPAITGIILAPINRKGGNINADSLVAEVGRLSHDKFDCITTLVDFYQFKGASGRNVKDIEDEMREKASGFPLGKTRFLPYVQQYEFEALLFADKSKIAEHMCWKGAQRKALTAIKGEPECINHDEPPATRIFNICREGGSRYYRKPTDGIAIIEEIGLDKIRQKCPRFGKWYNELSAFAKP